MLWINIKGWRIKRRGAALTGFKKRCRNDPAAIIRSFNVSYNRKTKQLDPAAWGYPSVKFDEYLVLITNRRRGWQISEQLQPLLRMENRDYAHVVRRVITQPLLSPWHAVPSGMRLEAAPKAARLGVGRTSWNIYSN
jgi:hypothetical protein